jgi:hypothetical protein
VPSSSLADDPRPPVAARRQPADRSVNSGADRRRERRAVEGAREDGGIRRLRERRALLGCQAVLERRRRQHEPGRDRQAGALRARERLCFAARVRRVDRLVGAENPGGYRHNW